MECNCDSSYAYFCDFKCFVKQWEHHPEYFSDDFEYEITKFKTF